MIRTYAHAHALTVAAVWIVAWIEITTQRFADIPERTLSL